MDKAINKLINCVYENSLLAIKNTIKQLDKQIKDFTIGRLDISTCQVLLGHFVNEI